MTGSAWEVVMKLEHARILLTGAAGGLGQELARQLHAAGASLAARWT